MAVRCEAWQAWRDVLFATWTVASTGTTDFPMEAEAGQVLAPDNWQLPWGDSPRRGLCTGDTRLPRGESIAV